MKPLARVLIGCLGSSEPTLAWRAALLLGSVVARLAGQDLEAGREVLRRLRWSLNEESGAIGWGAPQAMGEILAQSPELAQEFGVLVFSYLSPCANYLEHPALQAGVAWALGRLSQAQPQLAQRCQGWEVLLPLLASPLAQARGAAAWALGVMAAPQAAPALAGLASDPGQAILPQAGRVEAFSVGQLALEAAQGCRQAAFS